MKYKNLDQQTRMDYEAGEKALKDMASIREDGLQKVWKKEWRKVKSSRVKEVAKKMIEKGMDTAVIVELTDYQDRKSSN